jgi:two-component system cell cycle sensor histidine kinase/response regulator CckA
MAGPGTGTNGTHSGDSHGFNVWIAVGLLVGWIVLGNIGPMFELAPGIRAWYPPAALLAAAVTWWGARALVPIIIAASLSAILAPMGSEPLWRVLAVSAFMKIAYWAGARMLARFNFDPRFSRTVDVALFASAVAGAAAVSAVVAVVDMRVTLGEAAPDQLLLMRSFWIGDVVAVLALAPAMLVVIAWLTSMRGTDVHLPPIAWNRRNVAQAISIPVAILCAAALSPSLGFFSYALCILPLGWIALTHGPRVAALANVLFVLGALASVHDLTGTAPRSLEVQSFTALLVLTGLMIGSVADERERAFALLAESEERYRNLVELLPEPIIVHERGRVLFANGAAATVLGASSPAALNGVDLADLALPQSRTLIEERMDLLERGGVVPLVRYTVHKLDNTGIVEIESVSIPFPFEGRAAILTVGRDVTARIRLEDALRQAQRMEAVGRLAGGVAHDFNNLLTVITSYSELILAGLPEGAALEQDVREIHHAADRAAALTRQLLSFSRRQVLQTQPIDVSDAVRKTEALLRRLISSEIKIVSHLDPSAGRVLADRGQIEQVIVNLAVNARDAMPDGGTLTIETHRVDARDEPATARCSTQTTRYSSIVVRDTGVGIDGETLRQIFDPFFTTKAVGQGTGLGLATVHGIIEQAGGTIVVDTVVGEGTSFRVLLPMLADYVERVPELNVVDATASGVGRGRVLLVEDEDAVRQIIRRTLVDAGYAVVEAVDGLDALGILETQAASLDVVLSDVAMPRMDGRQLADHIRVRWPSLPVVMMSGFANPDLVRSNPGITLLLLKPFTTQALVAAIRDSLPVR